MIKQKIRCVSYLMLFILNVGYSQTPSNCNAPQVLLNVYDHDIKNITLREMYQAQSPDTALVRIPQYWLDPVTDGLAAIFNTNLLERDSIFSLYCVHDKTSFFRTHQQLLIEVDTNYTWTKQWQNLNALTGNPHIDSLVMAYDLSVTNFYNWSIGNFAVLKSDSVWNVFALIEQFELESGVIYGEPNGTIGARGKIEYQELNGAQYFDFYFEFNDCFDGCDNYRKWSFKVNSDCSVEYLGFTDWGYFMIEPLPSPLFCEISTSVDDVLNENSIRLYPNPTEGLTMIETDLSKRFEGTVSVQSLTGQILHTEQLIAPIGLQTFPVDLSGLSSGVYLISLQSSEAVVTSKLIKH